MTAAHRALVVTPSENAWFCFANECKAGGGVIELVAKVKQLSERDAAIEIQKHFLDPHKKVGTAENPLQPLNYLVTDHPFIKQLGLTKQTCEHFKAGYAPKGIMRGRLAIPIYDGDTLLAYVGVKPGDKPLLPKNFAGGLFGSYEAEFLTEDPLQVLLGHQAGEARGRHPGRHHARTTASARGPHEGGRESRNCACWNESGGSLPPWTPTSPASTMRGFFTQM